MIIPIAITPERRQCALCESARACRLRYNPSAREVVRSNIKRGEIVAVGATQARFLETLRLEAARRRLEETSQGLDQNDVGTRIWLGGSHAPLICSSSWNAARRLPTPERSRAIRLTANRSDRSIDSGRQ